MPLKFSPSKKVVKMRKVSVEFPIYDYKTVAAAAKRRKLPIREFIRMATAYAMANLED